MAPELVALGIEGKPQSVRYHVLPSLLLNELQKQQRTIDAQQAQNVALLARMERLESRLGASGAVAAR